MRKIYARGTKVVTKCKFCKFMATPVPNKVGKAHFHSGNLTQHMKQKHTDQRKTLISSKKCYCSSPAATDSTLDAFALLVDWQKSTSNSQLTLENSRKRL